MGDREKGKMGERTTMFIFATYLGISVCLLILGVLVLTIRWQLRFGGFWPWSVLLVLFLVPVAAGTIVESAMLSPASLEEMLPNYRSPTITTIEELRSFMISRNSSLIVQVAGLFFVLTILVAGRTLALAIRRKKVQQKDANGDGGIAN
jgi:hypothetical protein